MRLKEQEAALEASSSALAAHHSESLVQAEADLARCQGELKAMRERAEAEATGRREAHHTPVPTTVPHLRSGADAGVVLAGRARCAAGTGHDAAGMCQVQVALPSPPTLPLLSDVSAVRRV